jgi:hypothetical protein
MKDEAVFLAKGLVYWSFLLPVAVANGAFREGALRPLLGEGRAQAVSTFILSSFIFASGSRFCRRFFASEPVGRLLCLGGGWAALTVVFEFWFGHFVARKSWRELASNYNLPAGRLWPLVLLTLLLTPPTSRLGGAGPSTVPKIAS